MQLICGIRFKPEDQLIGMDILGHGQTWNVQAVSSTTSDPVEPIVSTATETPPPVAATVLPQPRKLSKRQSIRDVLQDAFT